MSGVGLEGRGAVVTGGGRGIGAAVARALAGAGAKVVLASRTEAEVEGVARELFAAGARAWGVHCDVADEASVRHLGEAARARIGQVDVLVNNAGGAESAPLKRMTLAAWEEALAVNATGTFLCTREFVPDMVARGFGRVVNVASIAGLEGAKFVANYSAAKHAVVGFTRSVALELAGSGVSIDVVCPAYVDTPLTERAIEQVRVRSGRSRAQALAAVLASADQDRLLDAGEVAEAVLALCRDDPPATSGRVVILRGSTRTIESGTDGGARGR
jgi:NAD(P)-dependent dehydrogenase (short-subunit alcohol dehydrogenase family)